MAQIPKMHTEDKRATGRTKDPDRTRFGGAVRRRRHAVRGSLDSLAVMAGPLVAAIFTGFNMFRFPHYELDEGIYVGSAWAMFERGELSYYTYTYDHPLLGWFQIGAISKLVGLFLTFGSSINAGRALMLAVAVFSTLLIFLIVRRVSGLNAAALFGAVIFAVSPLGVALHRQVWLDNLMTLWLLVSLYALIASDRRLWRLVVSALALGLAFWSKEIALVLVPGMFYLAYVVSHPANRRFALALWGAATASVVSIFVLLALLKDEFLPPGVLWSSPTPHVSLIETFSYQLHRSGGGSIFSPESDFRTFFAQWINADPRLMLAGLAAAALGLLFFRRDRIFFGVSLLALSFVLLLARGGVVLYFYVIPLLALLALALGLLAGHAINAVGAARNAAPVRPALSGHAAALAVLGLTLVVGIGAVPANSKNFTGDRTPSQNAATRWIANNLPNESVILMDPYAWVDLRSEKLVGDEPFNDAHSALTALLDPAIRGEVLQDPGDVDYILYGGEKGQESAWIDGRLGELGQKDLPLVGEARRHSDRIRTFRSGDWRMQLLRVRNLHRIPAYDNPVLQNTWEGYKERFIKGGRVIDPKSGGLTTSEGQAYAMLRAVYMNDQKVFDEVWGWTRENLRVREGDALLAWRYGKHEGSEQMGVIDENTATDADTDAALALLFAAGEFDAPQYRQEALRMLGDVWQQETTVVAGKRVLAAGDWARGGGKTGPVVNPSYFSPYAYKVFAKADPDHDWDAVADSSYEILQGALSSSELGGETGLVPNWVSVDPETGDPLPAEDNSEDLGDLPTDEFSFDATRVPWRISLDYLWFRDDRALDVMKDLSFPREQIEDEGKLLAAYSLDGEPTADHETTSAYAGILPGLLVNGDPALAHQVFASKILGAYHNNSGNAYWGEDPDDYYDQNMAWFATAVMDGSMGNLYDAGKKVIEWRETTIDPSLAGQSTQKQQPEGRMPEGRITKEASPKKSAPAKKSAPEEITRAAQEKTTAATAAGQAMDTAFVHRATGENSRGDYTYLSDPSIDGDPDAVVLVTPTTDRGSAGDGTYDHNIGVWYEPRAQKWAIFNQDRAAVPDGATFQVVVPGGPEKFVHHAKPENITEKGTYLDDPLVNAKPEAILSITQNWNPGGGGGTYNDHPVGIRYDAGRQRWALYNTDGSAIPNGAAFNVAVSGSVSTTRPREAPQIR